VSNRLLLDTHAFLWWKENNPRLSLPAREAIAGADLVFVSSASAWEVAIKASLGKIRLPRPFSEGVDESGFLELPIQFRHAAAVELLPPHHADPFDRMLVAQARVERLVIVTHDRAIEPYGAPVIWS
jgi:PIN domain nuclease of toxin-antitoxin system